MPSLSFPSIHIPLIRHLVLTVALALYSALATASDGLSGQYWNYNVDGSDGRNVPTSSPDLSRIDPTVDFSWARGSPDDGTIDNEYFTVRWQGEVQATESGNHRFSTESDDGVRLWVNDQLIIENWTNHGPRWDQSAQISLITGERYSIKMEFYERTGGAVARLHWQTPSNNTRRVIPQSQLYSQGSGGPEAGTCSIDQVASDGEEFRGISGSSDSNVIAVGHSGSFYHYDGTSWSQHPDSSDEDLHSVSVVNNSLAYAAGHNGRVLQFNGTNWSNFSSTNDDEDLNGIWAESGNAIGIAGKKATLEFSNGNIWIDVSGSSQANVDNNQDLRGVWADAENFYTVEKDGDLYHITQSSQNWNKISTCSDAFDDMDAKGLWGDGAGNIYITGQDKDPSPKEASIFRYDEESNSCSKVFSTTTEDKFEAISGYGSVIYAVGKDGLVATNASGSWVESIQGSEDWKAVWVSNTETPYYAGKDGYITTCTPAPPQNNLDHFKLSYAKMGLTCLASSINIQACADAACTTLISDDVDITLSPATGWASNPVTISSGQATLNLNHPAPGNLPLNITASSITPSNDLACLADTSNDATCSITVSDVGFVFDVPTLTACKSSANITIKAMKQGSNTTQCVSALTGTQTLSFWSAYDIPTSGQNNVKINGTNIATSNAGSNINLTFDSNGEAQFTAQYNDAGRLNLTARYDDGNGLTMTGVDTFVSAPVTVISYTEESGADCTSQNANCSIFKKAGEPFELKVKAACWTDDNDTDYSDNPETPNFELASIGISHNVLAPASGVNGQIGTNSLNFALSDGGLHSLQQTISEVGVFEFSLTLPSYLGQALTSTNSPAIGRFTPDVFQTTTGSNGTFGNSACSSFSYSGQAFSYQTNPQLTVTAYNAASPAVITQNYSGGFAKLIDTDFIVTTPLSDAIQVGADATTLLGLSWQAAAANLTDNNNGTLTFTLGNDNYTYLHEANSQIAPFNNAVNLTFTRVRDSDNVVANTVPYTLQPAGEAIRFGRIAVDSAHGSELAALTIGLRTEFFNGSDWLPNTQDQCTSLSLANQVRLRTDGGNYQTGNSTMSIQSGTSAATLATTLIGGNGAISLSAPGEDNQGYVDIQTNIATTHPWLLGDHDNTGIYNDESQSRASFGLFKGDDNMIFRRELY